MALKIFVLLVSSFILFYQINREIFIYILSS